LYRKALTYGTGLAAVVVIMLLLHSARFVIFERMNATSPTTSPTAAPGPAPATPRTQPSRSDTIQFQEARPRGKSPITGNSSSQRDREEPSESSWLIVMKRLIEQSEPYLIQATLVA